MCTTVGATIYNEMIYNEASEWWFCCQWVGILSQCAWVWSKRLQFCCFYSCSQPELASGGNLAGWWATERWSRPSRRVLENWRVWTTQLRKWQRTILCLGLQEGAPSMHSHPATLVMSMFWPQCGRRCFIVSLTSYFMLDWSPWSGWYMFWDSRMFQYW